MQAIRIIFGMWLLLGPASFLRADDGFFVKQVQPILEQHCVRCHCGDDPKGGLDLSSAKGLQSGGDSGGAIDPDDPSASLLLEMIRGDEPQMPEGGPALSENQVAAVRSWVVGGAKWPGELVLQPKLNTDWWSLKPLQPSEVPKLSSTWIRGPIDAFVLQKLESAGLAPNPSADRQTLIRRLTFDLHGLPPSPDEIEQFVQDSDPQAYEKLIDRLLASPRYGERWARHWLDVVHYGDTHGYDKDKRRPHAWPYRDYVIRSLNNDKPYGRFIEEQLAGDVLFADDPDGIIATGFIAAGPWDFVGHVELREGTFDKQITRNLDRDDMVANTMSTFCSLTVHCARCHDHKFDPITQSDYYSLQAVFAAVDRANRPYDVDPQIETLRSELTRQVKELGEKIKSAKKASTPTTDLQQQLDAANKQLAELPPKKLVYAAATQFPKSANFRATDGKPRAIHVLSRGSVKQPGEVALPGALTCLDELPARFNLESPDDEGSRRAALARWVTSKKNPLTWRSIVNRVWHYHFGRGLVETPNDFGRMGSLPTHPQLLDWLAADFRDNGQSLKRLHKMLLMSATYRQSSAHHDRHAKIDSGNRYLWRMNRRQLEAEALRDAVLFVSGQLDETMYGPGFDLFGFIDDHSPHYLYEKHNPDDPRGLRRSIYRFIVRSVPDPFMEALDCADPSQNVPVRNSTVTALQALALLNNKFMVRQGEHFARRAQEGGGDLSGQVAAAVRLAWGRDPTATEKTTLTEYAKQHGLANVCRLLLNANEFLFVD